MLRHGRHLRWRLPLSLLLHLLHLSLLHGMQLGLAGILLLRCRRIRTRSLSGGLLLRWQSVLVLLHLLRQLLLLLYLLLLLQRRIWARMLTDGVRRLRHLLLLLQRRVRARVLTYVILWLHLRRLLHLLLLHRLLLHLRLLHLRLLHLLLLHLRLLHRLLLHLHLHLGLLHCRLLHLHLRRRHRHRLRSLLLLRRRLGSRSLLRSGLTGGLRPRARRRNAEPEHAALAFL